MRVLTEEERTHMQAGLIPHCSECRDPIDIAAASTFKQSGDFVILPHNEVCPLSTLEWKPAPPRIGRTWKLWAYRYESGELWHVGARDWVKLYELKNPLVAVLAEEILGDMYADEVTHYGWQYPEGSRYQNGDVPTMIQVRAGNDPANPKRALGLLDMCFHYGMDAEIKRGAGAIVALRITARQEDA